MRGFAVLDPDVHVQPEDQVRARDQSACPRRPAGSARRDRCPAPASRRTDAWRRPRAAGRARAPARIIWRRRSTTSSRASPMLRQTPVPTSITAWCISALTFSFEHALALRDQLGLMCERRSKRVGIDGLVFLFDAEREGRLHRADARDRRIYRRDRYQRSSTGGAAPGPSARPARRRRRRSSRSCRARPSAGRRPAPGS